MYGLTISGQLFEKSQGVKGYNKLEGRLFAVGAPMTQQVDVFVSYSHEDRRRVRYLVRQLEHNGLDVWFDARLRPSETWPRRLREEIQRRRIFLFLITSATLQSNWCRWELYRAARANRLVLPVLFEKGVSVPPELRDVHYVDCSDRRGCAKKVSEAIHKILESAETRPHREAENPIGVSGKTLLSRLSQDAPPAPTGPRYPSCWRHWLMKRPGVLLGGMVFIAVVVLGIGVAYFRDGSNVSVTDTGLSFSHERTAGSAPPSAAPAASPTAFVAPSAVPVPTATVTVSATESAASAVGRVCALEEKVWVREQPLEGAHAFTSIAPHMCMEVRWLFTDDNGLVWGYVPEATRGALNRGGWVALAEAKVRWEGAVPSIFDAVLCEGRVRTYDAGLSTTTNTTPRYVSLRLGEHVWLFVYQAEADTVWYYAATQRGDHWVFGWISADQVSLLGQCPAPQ